MSKSDLILIGAGGHARSCIDVVEKHGQFEIAGLVGMPDEVNTTCLGYPIIATEEGLPGLANSFSWALVTVGQIESPNQRIRLFRLITRLGFQRPIIVAPTAHVSRHAELGAGTIVMHSATVNASATIGDNCIINSHALIEHGAVLGDCCHISTGGIVNGDVKIGSGSFVGSGSLIKEGVSVGQKCLIGMGLSVRHDMKAGTTFICEYD